MRAAPTMSGNWRHIVGALLLVAVVQLVVVEAVVASGWERAPYSWSENYISDLGLSVCVELDRVICSPRHAWINASFVVHGIVTGLGAALLADLINVRWRWILLGVVGLHAVGTVIVGAVPGSLVEVVGGDARQMVLHTMGSVLAIVFGNAAILLTGVVTWVSHRRFAALCLVLGGIGTAAIVMDTVGLDAGLGPGGVQRLSTYPIAAWLVLTGIVVLSVRIRGQTGWPSRRSVSMS